MERSLRKILYMLPRLSFHIAAAMIIVASIAGSFFKNKIIIEAGRDFPGMAHGFPYALTLEDFRIDRYPSGEPLNYTSTLRARMLNGADTTIVTAVNDDASLGGWRIFQMGYDTYAGEDTSFSILECVYDPFYPLTAFALWLVIAGSAVLAVKTIPGTGGRKKLWTLSAFLFVVFIYLTTSRVGIGHSDLRPALRSGWFIPHIVAYMMAYALLTATTVYAVILAVRSHRHPPDNAGMATCDRLARLGWAFLSMGMCMGALWAKQSWGDWWTWDPKESWALITWISYGASVHLHGRIKKGRIIALLLISYLLLQMCWWGVNLLPSSGSLHVY